MVEGGLTPATETSLVADVEDSGGRAPRDHRDDDRVGPRPIGLITEQRIDAEPGLGRCGDDVVGERYPPLKLCVRNATVLT